MNAGRGRTSVLRDGLLMSVGTLTALPVPAPTVIDRRTARVAMSLAFVPALLLAIPAVVIVFGADATGLPPLVGAGLVIGAVTLMTRGLHLDGLADTADGLAASYDRERALQVMRTGDAGPAGVTAIALVLLLQVAALAALWPPGDEVILPRDGLWYGPDPVTLSVGGPATLLAIALVISRVMLAVACSRGFGPARPEGLGAMVAESVPRTVTVLLLLVGTVVGALAAAASYAPAVAVPAAVACAVVVTLLILLRTRRRLGGVTGDVLGAVVEVSFAAALVALSVF